MYLLDYLCLCLFLLIYLLLFALFLFRIRNTSTKPHGFCFGSCHRWKIYYLLQKLFNNVVFKSFFPIYVERSKVLIQIKGLKTTPNNSILYELLFLAENHSVIRHCIYTQYDSYWKQLRFYLHRAFNSPLIVILGSQKQLLLKETPVYTLYKRIL